MKQIPKKYFVIGAVVLMLLLLNPSNAVASIIKQFEVGPNGDPYLKAIPDARGYWQIGYGSTWNYTKNRWVEPGDTITRAEAEMFLNREIAEKTASVQNSVRVPINNNQKMALVSLSYNIGKSAFESSDLLELLNAGADKRTVANQFDRWIYADGKINRGLVNRRAMEKQLFLS